MAASNLNLGKASGGVLNIQPADGTGNTNVVIPENGTLINDSTAQTISAVKTFTSSPIVPTPTNNTQAANKSYVDSKYSGFKNYIINGNFDIWQRGEVFSPGTSLFFTADRWVLDWAGLASGLSASKQPGLVGKNSLYIRRTGGAKMQIYQMVENQGNLSNKIFTFSALVRGTTNGTVNFKVVDGRTGTNFAYEQTPVTLEANITKKIVFTVQLGQVSADALFVGLLTSCIGLTIERVQMEEGSVATPFENRPIGLELSLCERYYEINNSLDYSGVWWSGNITTGSVYYTSAKFKIRKRTFPTMTKLQEDVLRITNVSIDSANADGIRVSSTGTEAGYGYFRLGWSADAEL